MEVDKLDKSCDLFGLKNLIKTQRCCNKNQKSTIDLFLTNKPVFSKNQNHWGWN